RSYGSLRGLRMALLGLSFAYATNSAVTSAAVKQRLRLRHSHFWMTSAYFCLFVSRQIHRPQMPDRTAGGDRLRRRDDGVGVDAVVAIEVGDRAGLAEVLDPERAHAMAAYGAEPGERRRVAVEHGDDAAMGRHVGKQPLDMRTRVHEAA